VKQLFRQELSLASSWIFAPYQLTESGHRLI
jgi:hypothetical protein